MNNFSQYFAIDKASLKPLDGKKSIKLNTSSLADAEFYISTDNAQLQFDVIYKVISNSYWAKGISEQVMQKAIDNSLCFGIYVRSKADNGESVKQVGFARMITDRATFAYLADVFVVDDYQGVGLSRALMDVISNHEQLQGLRRMMLATRDAHGLYSQYGFTPITQPESLMQNWNPTVYQS